MKTLERKHSFGTVARDYQKYRKTYNPKLYRHLFSLLNKDQKNIKILDLGCGTGKSTAPLAELASKKIKNKLEIIGMDPDPKMLVEARKYAALHKLPIKYMEGSAEKLAFEKETFDAVIAGTAFHWFATKKVVTNIRKTLKSEGVCMVFWTWRKKGANKSEGGVNAVLQKYNWQTYPSQWRDPEVIKKLFYESGLSHFSSVVIPYTEHDSIEYLVGLTKTVAAFALLSPARKKKCISELTAAYKEILGKRKTLTIKRELTLCYAFK